MRLRSGGFRSVEPLSEASNLLRALFEASSGASQAFRTLYEASQELLRAPGDRSETLPGGPGASKTNVFPWFRLGFHISHDSLIGGSQDAPRGSSAATPGPPGALPRAPGILSGRSQDLPGVSGTLSQSFRDALPEPPGALLAAPEAFQGTPGLSNSLPERPRSLQNEPQEPSKIKNVGDIVFDIDFSTIFHDFGIGFLVFFIVFFIYL